jgi:hypothetical protein
MQEAEADLGRPSIKFMDIVSHASVGAGKG